MTRNYFHWLILAVFLLGLAFPSADADGGSETVGIRVFNSGAISLQSAISDDTFVIDYGSFQWMVLTKDELPKLDAMGVTYQAIEAPYKLTLGGQSFDPLLSKPDFAAGWRELPTRSGPGLRLIQFHGPTKEEWLKDLEEDGVTPVQYIHPFTYLVWGAADAVQKSAQRYFVRWTGDYLPAYAVQTKNRVLGSEPIHFRAMTLPQAGLDKIIAALEALGASQVAASSGFDPAFDLVSFILPGDQLQAAASLPGVYSIQPVPTDGGDRGEMSNQINAGKIDASNRAIPGYQTWLAQVNLSGHGVIIANVDSGILETHPDLVNRMAGCIGSSCGTSTTASNHGTHTAGIMAGDGSSGVIDSFGFLRGLGMAPGAKLVEQVYDPIYRQENGMLTLMTESYRNGAVISGNSWGPSGTPQGYDYDTRLVDIGVRDADPETPGNQALTFVLSIMNGKGGTSTQGTPDEAKNTFTIGSTYMQNDDSTGSQRLNINDLSYNTAHGPALDGRMIPHMVAPGCYVDSTSMTSLHGLMCGTSMASPQVSGAAALFHEQYRNRFGQDPSPALVKAAFLPVAHDLMGNKDADGGILGHPFDAKQGWGRLDADAVLDPAMSVLYYDQETLFHNTGEFWGFPIKGELDELRAMLVWTDAPGHGLGGDASAWVNDLDLSVSFNGQTYYGNNFGADGFSVPGGSPDMMNNTEGVFLRNLNSDIVTITVTAANIAGDGVPNLGDDTDQDFALAVYYSLSDKTYKYILPIIYR
ncbi:MAG: Peptidase S8 and S53 subtilisin kexin sedolisin [Anaerolineaceae bacterium 46_22]|nr:MAG: Peptidase S8 and S53 subtilisin kexin sedolisin [Anaerolineaceae bacterium 46_22]